MNTLIKTKKTFFSSSHIFSPLFCIRPKVFIKLATLISDIFQSTMKQQEATLKAQQEAQEQIRFNQRLQQEILEEKLRQMRSKRRPANNSSQDSSGSSNGPNRLANFEFENDKSEGSIFSKYHFFSDIIFSRNSFATLIL